MASHSGSYVNVGLAGDAGVGEGERTLSLDVGISIT